MAKISCFIGTVYGCAETLATELESIAKSGGHIMQLFSPGTLDDVLDSEMLFIVTSTTGQGDIPFELEALYLALKQNQQALNKPFAVITLGDSSYCDTYCGAGVKFRQLLLELQGSEVVPMLKIDAMEGEDPLTLTKPWFDRFLSALK